MLITFFSGRTPARPKLARLGECLPVTPASIAAPSGDRPTYSLDEGLTCA